jgi:hypothetical protein
MSPKTAFWSRYGMPISLIVCGMLFFGEAWRAQSAGRGIVYWNRGGAITPQALFLAAGGFLIVGILLFILRRGHE